MSESAPKEEHELWFQAAGKVAEKALCLRAKCGTVIVKDDKIIGEGYNGPPLDDIQQSRCHDEFIPGKTKYDKTCCLHAEWRAIMNAIKRHPQEIAGSDLYFTRVDDHGVLLKSGAPFCTVCSRLALDAGVARFFLWHNDGIVGYPTLEYNNLSYLYRPE